MNNESIQVLENQNRINFRISYLLSFGGGCVSGALLGGLVLARIFENIAGNNVVGFLPKVGFSLLMLSPLIFLAMVFRFWYQVLVKRKETVNLNLLSYLTGLVFLTPLALVLLLFFFHG